MALEINAQFKQFVQFAKQQMKAGNEKAIARDSGRVEGQGPLAGRVISAATGDKVAKLGWRSKNNKDANNAARDLFLNAACTHQRI